MTYYDFTSDDPSGGTLDTDYWGTASRDGGATFAGRERLTRRAFDMRSAPFAGGFFVGDYEGLTSVPRPFVPVFVTANDGNTANPTDAFSRQWRPSFGATSAARRHARARASARKPLARLIKRAGAITGPVKIR